MPVYLRNPDKPIEDAEYPFPRWDFLSVPADVMLNYLPTVSSDTAKVLTHLILVAYGSSYPFPPFLSARYLASRLHMPRAAVDVVLAGLLDTTDYLEVVKAGRRQGYRIWREYDPSVTDEWEANPRAIVYQDAGGEPLRARMPQPSKKVRPIVMRFNATCVYCKQPGTPHEGPDGRGWHKDHVHAKVNGGRGGTNYVLACATCNQRKHALSATDFLASLESERANG